MRGQHYEPMDGISLIFGDGRSYDALDLNARLVLTAPRCDTAGSYYPGGKLVKRPMTRQEIITVADRFAGPLAAVVVMAAPDRYLTANPVGFMQRLIEAMTEPGELVVDPFCNKGATAAACVQSGRRFVGFEADRARFKLACVRAAHAVGILRKRPVMMMSGGVL